MRFPPEVRQRLRRALLARGHVLATLLAEVLAGKASEARVRAIAGALKPGERPAEKLLDAGDDAYGRCDACGEDLGEIALGEMPWADRCRAHHAS